MAVRGSLLYKLELMGQSIRPLWQCEFDLATQIWLRLTKGNSSVRYQMLSLRLAIGIWKVCLWFLHGGLHLLLIFTFHKSRLVFVDKGW